MDYLDEIINQKIDELHINEDTGALVFSLIISTGLVVTGLSQVFEEVQNLRLNSKIDDKWTKKINDLTGGNYSVRVIKYDLPFAMTTGGKDIYITTKSIQILNEREVIATFLHEAHHVDKMHVIVDGVFYSSLLYIVLGSLAKLIENPKLLKTIPSPVARIFLSLLFIGFFLAVPSLVYRTTIARRMEIKSDLNTIKYGYGKDLISSFEKEEKYFKKHFPGCKTPHCKIIEKISDLIDEHPSLKLRIQKIIESEKLYETLYHKKIIDKKFISDELGQINNEIN